jgi:hypothetical protein
MGNISKLSPFNKINKGDNHELGEKEMMLTDASVNIISFSPKS